MTAEVEQDFRRRWGIHGARLIAYLHTLYADAPDFPAFCESLRDRLAAYAAARNDELRLLDAAREKTRDWFTSSKMIGYSAYVDRFAGDLRGVAEKVPYLQSLGVSYLHLLPIFKMRAGDNDGGFAVADFLAIDERFGDIGDLNALCGALRKANISLCLDLVMNHTSDDHAWARAARSGNAFYRDFYMLVKDAAEVQEYERTLLEVFPGNAPGNFTYVPDLDSWVWTTFYNYQWDLNYRNPHVFFAIAEIVLEQANNGVEVFRLDSVAFLWKQIGTNCRNLEGAHTILRALRAVVDIVAPGVILKAEAIVPGDQVLPYFGYGKGAAARERECHLAYHNSLMIAGWAALANGDADLPKRVLTKLRNIPPNTNWASYARCHDDIGWRALVDDLADVGSFSEADAERVSSFYNEGLGSNWAKGEAFAGAAMDYGLRATNGTLASLAGLEAASDTLNEELALRRICLMHALCFASGGLPIVYMGDELGLLNDYSYSQDSERAHEGRWLHRPAMDWARARQAENAQGIAGRIFHDIQRLRSARSACGEVTSPEVLECPDRRLLGLRYRSGAVAFLNFGPDAVAAPIGPGSWRDHFSGALFHNTVDLDGYGVSFLCSENL